MSRLWIFDIDFDSVELDYRWEGGSGKAFTLHHRSNVPRNAWIGPILSSGYIVPSIRQIFTGALTAKFTFHLLPALTLYHGPPSAAINRFESREISVEEDRVSTRESKRRNYSRCGNFGINFFQRECWRSIGRNISKGSIARKLWGGRV